MSIISWIILGLLAGVLAKWIMPGKDGGGFIMTTLLGIAGAVVGGWVSTLLGIGSTTGLSIGGIVMATVGALILLFFYNRFAR